MPPGELQELISAAFEPAMAMLDALDLDDLPVEPDLDPGRPPRRHEVAEQ
ncbi:MAG TPA: hypothetical protein VG899_14030 [Mycobacteriales bacterium]|nr:hypothetical protein [Mycobacteriales bacterium]